MLTIRALIVDDESLARDRLRGLLAAEPGFETIGECTSETQALEAIRDENPDLVFLDLHLPGGDGRQVLARLPEDRRPAIVVATAHEEFARAAFDFAVVDYLLKPFDQERFRQALRRVKQYLLAKSGSPPPRPERLTVKTDGRLVFLRTEEIVRLEADDNLVTLHLRDQCLVVRETLGALEARLDPRSFVRVNRSTVVNVDQIREVISEPAAEGTVILRDGTKLPLGRGLRAQFDRFAINATGPSEK
jgi:two-component system LytT family response regulator